MRKLLDFLLSKRHWILFIFLEVLAFTLIYRNNAYQRNVMISSANAVTGNIASVSGYFTSYLNLRDINEKLVERNGDLEIEIFKLQEELDLIKAEATPFTGYVPDSTEQFPYHFIMAKVVNNSVSHLSNYITINKGRKDGVKPDMGVVSGYGVVGIVSNVSDHFSVVIPILNPKLRLSCKILGSSHFGSLGWNGRSARHANLDELPRHVEFVKGDTVVTSGFSAVFPPGLMIGTVSDFERQHDDNFFSLEIELKTDFQALDDVRVISNYYQAEQTQLEIEAKKND